MATSWQSVFDDALHRASVIAVRTAVAEHLGRVPTRSELTAARRAANTYSASANTQIIRVPNPNGAGSVMLLARADADVADSDLLHDIASARPKPRPKHRGAGTANPAIKSDNITGAINRASKSAEMLHTASLDRDHAAQLADDLDAALPALMDLRRRLRLRSQTDE